MMRVYLDQVVVNVDQPLVHNHQYIRPCGPELCGSCVLTICTLSLQHGFLARGSSERRTGERPAITGERTAGRC